MHDLDGFAIVYVNVEGVGPLAALWRGGGYPEGGGLGRWREPCGLAGVAVCPLGGLPLPGDASGDESEGTVVVADNGVWEVKDGEGVDGDGDREGVFAPDGVGDDDLEGCGGSGEPACGVAVVAAEPVGARPVDLEGRCAAGDGYGQFTGVAEAESGVAGEGEDGQRRDSYRDEDGVFASEGVGDDECPRAGPAGVCWG